MALVDEARKAGRRMAAHAHGTEGVLAAVKVGVDSIEHGTFMSDETLALMRQKGTYYVPTFTGMLQPFVTQNPREIQILEERRREGLPVLTRLTKLAQERGVPLAAGTDVRYATADLSMADEARFLQRLAFRRLAYCQP